MGKSILREPQDNRRGAADAKLLASGTDNLRGKVINPSTHGTIALCPNPVMHGLWQKRTIEGGPRRPKGDFLRPPGREREGS